MRRTMSVWFSWLWLWRIPLLLQLFALLTFVYFGRRGNTTGMLSSAGLFGMGCVLIFYFRAQLTKTRQLYERHLMTADDLSPGERLSSTEEVVRAIQQHEAVAFVNLPAILDEEALSIVEERWTILHEAGKQHFLLQCERLQEVTPEGIQALERWDTLLNSESGSFFLVQLPADVRLHLELLSPTLFNASMYDIESAMWIVWSKV